ncbi:MAG: SOS response-associated peptidase [bacterium]
MCGRYSLITQREDLARALEIAEDLIFADLAPRWNIAPTQPVPVLRRRGSEPLEMTSLRWGLVPNWAKDLSSGARTINARRETLATKPTFRESFRSRRCAVIADGFYEWRDVGAGRPKVPHYIRLRSGDAFTFAGLWDAWRAPDGHVVESCTIVTGPPNELLSTVHDRMPMILDPRRRDAWIDPERTEQELLPLLEPYAANDMEMFAVSRHVNSPANDDERCLEPPEEAAGSQEAAPSWGPLFDD